MAQTAKSYPRQGYRNAERRERNRERHQRARDRKEAFNRYARDNPKVFFKPIRTHIAMPRTPWSVIPSLLIDTYGADFFQWLVTRLGLQQLPMHSSWTQTISCGGGSRGPFPGSIAACGGLLTYNITQEGTLGTAPGPVGFTKYVAAYLSQVTVSSATHLGGPPGAAYEMLVPNMQPEPDPPMVPIIVPEPAAKPEPAPYNEPSPEPSPNNDPDSKPSGSASTSPQSTQRGDAVPAGSGSTVGTYGARSRAWNERGRNERKKPEGKQKEKKWKGSQAALSGLGKLFGALTEMQDFVDALHEALPKKLQKSKGLYGKFEDVVNGWEEIDGMEALKNLMENYLEDAVVGRANKNFKDSISKVRSELGLDTRGTKYSSLAQVPR